MKTHHLPMALEPGYEGLRDGLIHVRSAFPGNPTAPTGPLNAATAWRSGDQRIHTCAQFAPRRVAQRVPRLGIPPPHEGDSLDGGPFPSIPAASEWRSSDQNLKEGRTRILFWGHFGATFFCHFDRRYAQIRAETHKKWWGRRELNPRLHSAPIRLATRPRTHPIDCPTFCATKPVPFKSSEIRRKQRNDQ